MSIPWGAVPLQGCFDDPMPVGLLTPVQQSEFLGAIAGYSAMQRAIDEGLMAQIARDRRVVKPRWVALLAKFPWGHGRPCHPLIPTLSLNLPWRHP